MYEFCVGTSTCVRFSFINKQQMMINQYIVSLTFHLSTSNIMFLVKFVENMKNHTIHNNFPWIFVEKVCNMV